ncbi:MAG: hypothetical protein ACREC5_02635 [Thermoplasmata archaeon]
MGSAPPRRRPRRRRWTAWFWGLGPALTEEERRAAIADPGPSWRQYFLRDFLRWWTALGYFVVDAVIVASYLRPPDPAAILLELTAALYLEYLLYEFLWYTPRWFAEGAGRYRTEAPTGWRRAIRPVAAGRWTDAYRWIRSGREVRSTAPGPDPREFL